MKVKSPEMNISKLALVLTLALTFALSAASTAFAQVSVYGTVSVRRMTDIHYTQGTTTATNGSFNAVGGTGGIFYDFRKVGPVRLGVDARGTIASSTQGAYTSYNGGGSHLSSGLFGVRGTFHTPFIAVKPYVQGSVGIARTNFGTDYNNTLVTTTLAKNTGIQISSHLEYDAFAGVDIAILPLVDFRMVELGYGAVQGPSNTYPVKSLSSGIVFHLPWGLGK